MTDRNSFDVFDTLIARRRVEPYRVLQAFERRMDMPGLAQARLRADQNLGAFGRPYQLLDIWKETARLLHLEESLVQRLMALEMQMEQEEVIPIEDNLALVRDGDLLVSDTYLPAEIVRSLLHKAGLDKQVALVVSNDGKFRGWIWKEVLAQVSIREHFGDNPDSDGRTPTESGIRSIIYTGSRLTPIEQHLSQHGWRALAELIREVRLANPFAPSRPQERHLWNLSCQLNFPLLFLASLWLERSCRRDNIEEVYFVSRDCLMWLHLFRRLFSRRATYLYASRLCALCPTESYLNYFRCTWHERSVIVDLSSTGASWARLFARLNIKGTCRFLAWIDDYVYLEGGPQPKDWLQTEVLFRSSQLSPPMNKSMEMLNYAPHGRVEDVLWVAGTAIPVLAQELEYDRSLPEVAHRAFAACVKALDHHGVLDPFGEAPEGLIPWFVSQICADPHLGSIYPGHQQADLAYQQRLRAALSAEQNQ